VSRDAAPFFGFILAAVTEIPEKEKLLRCHRAAWAAWIIETVSSKPRRLSGLIDS
jgi:hypothetical protein